MPRYDSDTALLVVDMQNDFADPTGSLYVHGGEELLPFVNGEIERAGAAGAMVVYTQDWHPEVTPHFAKYGGTWPVHCVADSWGAQFHPQLQVKGRVVRKGTGGEDGYSGFSMRHPTSGEATPTELEPILRAGGVRRLVICGLATDYCVKETAIDGLAKGFEVRVLPEGVAAVELQPGDGRRAIEAAREAGAVIGD